MLMLASLCFDLLPFAHLVAAALHTQWPRFGPCMALLFVFFNEGGGAGRTPLSF